MCALLESKCNTMEQLQNREAASKLRQHRENALDLRLADL